jgi:hypothetical protein
MAWRNDGILEYWNVEYRKRSLLLQDWKTKLIAHREDRSLWERLSSRDSKVGATPSLRKKQLPL